MYYNLTVDDLFFDPGPAIPLRPNADNVTHNLEIGRGRGGEVVGKILVYSWKNLRLCQRQASPLAKIWNKLHRHEDGRRPL